jgi:hypothetical protein
MIKKIALATVLSSTLLFGAETIVETEKSNNDTKITKTTLIKGSHATLPGDGSEEGGVNVKDPVIQGLIQQAYQKGYQEGADDAMQTMNDRLIKMESYMDGLFNFHRLVLEGKYEPPTIGIINSGVAVSEDGQEMTIQERSFKVLSPGKFVEEPKTWQTFLLDGNK